MRFHGLKVRITDRASNQFDKIGYIESYKWYLADVIFIVRFHNKLETFYHYQIEITEESIEEWKKYSGEVE